MPADGVPWRGPGGRLCLLRARGHSVKSALYDCPAVSVSADWLRVWLLHLTAAVSHWLPWVRRVRVGVRRALRGLHIHPQGKSILSNPCMDVPVPSALYAPQIREGDSLAPHPLPFLRRTTSSL